MRFGLRKNDLSAPGYKKLDHAGLSWLANEQGVGIILEVEDWRPEALGHRIGWNCETKRHHTVYLGTAGGMKCIVKSYPLEENGQFRKKMARATNEFFEVMLAHRKNIATVLPLAVAEGGGSNLIIYPYLSGAIPLERVYSPGNSRILGIRDRQGLEKKVGALLRGMNRAGIYPVDSHLDHFLATRSKDGGVAVYYIDLERLGFNSFFSRWLKRTALIKTLARLLARLEWLRVSGGTINRASMMRMGRAFFYGEERRRLDKRLGKKIIQAARKFWYRRKFHKRGTYRLRSFPPKE